MALSTVKKTAFTSRESKSREEIPVTQTPVPKVDILKKIQEKAYELYLKRNGGPGSAEEDWAQAEKIVKSSLR
ncbi:MAG: DUF2934 domain-containing protein [Candidatus Omnitrophica bacterium]|nr:DUF2934 domain-containing protein [Candidatus Omnitrophota bacterium]